MQIRNTLWRLRGRKTGKGKKPDEIPLGDVPLVNGRQIVHETCMEEVLDASLAADCPLQLFRTRMFGKIHPDTESFDDSKSILVQNFMEVYKKSNKDHIPSWRIAGIRTIGNTYCNGLQLIYELAGQIVEAPKHAGNHHSPQETEFLFDKNEHILGVSGGCGNWLDFLIIKTNTREIRCGSSEGGHQFEMRIPNGSRLVSFYGGVGGHIHNIGLIYTSEIWSPETNILFSDEMKRTIKSVLILALKKENKSEPKYPEVGFHLIPRDVLYYIFQLLAHDEAKNNEVMYALYHSIGTLKFRW